MPGQPLVSIIIPTYNRANLIGETLDSVLAQTYTNWECIVVDDGSTDTTEELVTTYISKDSRFQYYKRPNTHLSGGNGARNYGFKVSKGDYIQWFDSDDLLHEKKIEVKVNTIEKYGVDFVISKTKYFNKEKRNPYSYDYKEDAINFLSYSTTYVSWFTPDMFIKRRIAEQVTFNELIKAGQEYNFSCKLLLITHHVKKIDEFLTLRRFHMDSIGKKRQLDRQRYWNTNFFLHWVTLNELQQTYKLPTAYVKYALVKCSKAYLMNSDIKIPLKFHQTVFRVYGLRAFYLYLAKTSKIVFNHYYYFYTKFKRK